MALLLLLALLLSLTVYCPGLNRIRPGQFLFSDVIQRTGFS